MKILLISPMPPATGGIASWTVSYLNFFQNKEEIRTVNTNLIGKRLKSHDSHRSFVTEFFRTKNIIFNLKREVKQFKPNIVHLNTSCSNFGIIRDYICAKISKKRGSDIILHCHCNIDDQLTFFLSKRIFTKLAKLSTKIIVLNSFSYKYVSIIGFQNKCTILPNFIDRSFFNGIPKNGELKKIIYVGHVIYTKGCNELIECANYFTQVEFYLVGSVGDEFKRKEFRSNIHMLGEVPKDKIRDYLLRSDAFLFPSYTEGFSISLLEAMAVGLPCIATDVGANRDMLENKGGLIVPTKDVTQLRNAIEILFDKKLREEMSEWNIKKVRENYISEDVLNRLYEIYKDVI